MIIFPYISAVISGYFLICLLFRNFRPFDFVLHLSLSVGIGLGVHALLNFLILLTLGSFKPKLLIILSVLVPGLLFAANLFASKEKPLAQTKLSVVTILFFIMAVIAGFLITFIANIHPYGEWDAWALWNMKLKFLLLSGTEWRNIFTQLHASTHPDYPILLPLMNMLPYAFSNSLLLIPKVTGILLTLTTGIVLFAGLRTFTPAYVALLAFTLLMLNTFYIYQSTSQYADVLIGLYLLMSFVCISLWEKERRMGYVAFLGMILGLMTFTKNEGMVMAGLLASLFTMHLVMNKHSIEIKKTLKIFAVFIIGFSVLTFYLKIALAPRNSDVLTSLSWQDLKFFNTAGLQLILTSYQKEFLHLHWSYLWILCAALIVLGIRRVFQEECKIYSLFFILFFIILTLIYLTTANFDLSWWLETSLMRILGYLLPSILFYAFTINYRFSTYGKKTSQS